MNESKPGVRETVESDGTSTINTTIPRNITTMFRSATADRGTTISGLFDIQYRLGTINRYMMYGRGRPFVGGVSRHIESLVQQDKVLIKEGLIVDTKYTPGQA